MTSAVQARQVHTSTAFEEFAETTGLAGVLYAYQGSTVERIFWSILVLISIALTVRDLGNLIEQYTDEQTVAVITVVSNNSMTLPDPSVCLRTTRYLSLSSQYNIPINGVIKFFDEKADIAQWMYDHASDIILPKEHITLLVHASNALFSFAYAEAKITEAIALGYRKADLTSVWSQKDSVENPWYTNATALNIYLIQRRVNFALLREALALTWIAQHQLRFYAPGTRTEQVIRQGPGNPMSLIWFGTEPFRTGNESSVFRFCFRMAKSAKFFTFHTNQSEYFAANKLLPLSYTSAFPTIEFVFSMTERTSLYSSWGKQTFTDDNQLDYMISIKLMYIAANLRRQPCSSSVARPNFDCKGLCQARFMMSACGCYPLNWQWENGFVRPTSVPFCGLGNDDSDTNFAVLQSCVSQASDNTRIGLKGCIEQCIPDCSSTFLTITVGQPPDDKTVSSATIRLGHFQYMALQEMIGMSAVAFMGCLGGIIGVWTGLSLITLLHTLLFAIKWLGAVVHNLLMSRSKRFRNVQLFKFCGKAARKHHLTRGRLHDFAESTGINGILYVFRGNYAEQIVWIILVAVSLCLTLQNLEEIIADYTSQGTSTDVRVITSSNISILEPTMCLLTDSNSLWQSVRTFESYNLLKISDVNTVLAFFDNVPDICALLSAHATDPTSIMQQHAAFLILATHLFFGLAYAENAMVANSLSGSALRVVPDWTSHMGKDAAAVALGKSVLQLRNYLMQRNVDMVALRNLVAVTWASQLGIVLQKPSDNDEKRMVDIAEYANVSKSAISWFGTTPLYVRDEHSFCFRIPQGYALFTFTNTEKKFFTATYKQAAYAKKNSELVFPTAQFIFSQDRAMTYGIPWYTWTQGIREDQYVFFTYESQLHRQRCSTTNNLDCKLACQMDFILNTCKCYPLALSWEEAVYSTSRAPLCGLTNSSGVTSESLKIKQLADCVPASRDSRQLTRCFERCLPDCIVRQYSFRDANVLPSTNGQSSLSITLDRFQYLQLTERLSMSQSDFIGRVGGVLGCWTGACALAYLHALIALCEWLWATNCIKRCRLRVRRSITWKFKKNYFGGALALKQLTYWQDFFISTGISGISYAYYGRSRIERTFWLVMTGISLVLTMKDLIFLTNDFLSEATSTSVIINLNGRLQLPDPVICLRMQPTFSVLYTVQGIKKKHKLDLENANNVAALLAYFDSVKDVTDWMVTHQTNVSLTKEHVGLFVLSTYMFFALTNSENIITSVWLQNSPQDINASWSYFLRYRGYINADNMGASILRTRDYLVSRQVNFARFRQALTVTWVTQISLSFTTPMNVPHSLSSLAEDVIPTWFGTEPFMFMDQHSICFRLRNSSAYLTFHSNHGESFKATFTAPRFATYDNPSLRGYISLDLALTASDRVNTQNMNSKHTAEWGWDSDYVSYFVTYEYQHVAVNRPQRPCSSNNTNFDCKGMCYINFITDICQCYPSSWLWGASAAQNMDLCGLSETDLVHGIYINKLQSCVPAMSRKYTQFLLCRESCKKDCTTTSFAFESKDRGKKTGTLSIVPSGFQYIVYKETLWMTDSDFLGNFGGILGIWTGACVISYIHAIIYMVKWLFKRCNAAAALRLTTSKQRPTHSAVYSIHLETSGKAN